MNTQNYMNMLIFIGIHTGFTQSLILQVTFKILKHLTNVEKNHKDLSHSQIEVLSAGVIFITKSPNQKLALLGHLLKVKLDILMLCILIY